MPKETIFSQIRSLISGRTPTKELRLREEFRLGRSAVRVPYTGAPIGVTLVPQGLEYHVYPEILTDTGSNPPDPCFLLFEPGHDYTRIGGFLRLQQKGDSLILGGHDRKQAAMFDYPPNMDKRILNITHDGDALVFNKLVYDAKVLLAPLGQERTAKCFSDRRSDKLRRIRAIYGGPIEPLGPEQALDTLRAVNEILAMESYRPLDRRGRPGGVLQLPKELRPIIVGDLHAQVDNLLTLLSQNGFLEALEQGTAAMIILGDAVHLEEDGQLDEMESSVLMTDLILRLKLRFPKQIFYIRGNHDSFAEDQFKFGVAQCLLWERALRERRGMDYLHEMERFYDGLPYLVLSEGYIACHAAPVKTKFTLEMLINTHEHPGLVGELTRNRLRRRNFPAGYAKGDVRHFLETLGFPEGTPYFVSHSPLTRDETLWLNAGGIKNHHIVFSANRPWIGVVTRIHGHMIPLTYQREELTPIISGLAT